MAVLMEFMIMFVCLLCDGVVEMAHAHAFQQKEEDDSVEVMFPSIL